jgi:hypothetical protein
MVDPERPNQARSVENDGGYKKQKCYAQDKASLSGAQDKPANHHTKPTDGEREDHESRGHPVCRPFVAESYVG